MLQGLRARTAGTRNLNATRLHSLVRFSIGGRVLAVRIDEDGGVQPWTVSTFAPSQTPFINAVVLYGNDFLPVFDLAGRLKLPTKSQMAFCMVAKHARGPIAVRIDKEIPSLQTVDAASIRPSPDGSEDFTGWCTMGGEEVPILSFEHLVTPAGGGPAPVPERTDVQ